MSPSLFGLVRERTGTGHNSMYLIQNIEGSETLFLVKYVMGLKASLHHTHPKEALSS